MNKRLKELAEQSGFQKYFLGSGYIVRDQELERFADLVRQDEREACAVLCTEMGNKQTNEFLYDPWDCASSIRARGNHDTER